MTPALFEMCAFVKRCYTLRLRVWACFSPHLLVVYKLSAGWEPN